MAVQTLPTSAEVTSATQTNAQQKVDLASLLDFLLAQLGKISGQGPQAVASAATLDLDAVTDTRDIVVSGTTAITAVTIEAGKVFRCIASGAFTLTNNAAIVTGTGANIQVAAGDSFILRATAANVVSVLMFTRVATVGARCGVWASTSQIMAAALTEYTLQLNTEDYDVFGEFNTSTYTFTAKDAGKFRFSVTVGMNLGTSGDWGQVSLLLNGSRKRTSRASTGDASAAKCSPILDTSLLLAIGDTVSVVIQNSSASANRTTDATGLSGERVFMSVTKEG